MGPCMYTVMYGDPSVNMMHSLMCSVAAPVQTLMTLSATCCICSWSKGNCVSPISHMQIIVGFIWRTTPSIVPARRFMFAVSVLYILFFPVHIDAHYVGNGMQSQGTLCSIASSMLSVAVLAPASACAVALYFDIGKASKLGNHEVF